MCITFTQFPTDIPMRKMQGGGTVRTWDIPPEAERLSYYIRTNGRPLKALVELVRFFIVVICIESSFIPWNIMVIRMAMHFVAIAVTRNLWVKNTSSHLKGIMNVSYFEFGYGKSEWAQNMMPIEKKSLNKISLLGSI